MPNIQGKKGLTKQETELDQQLAGYGSAAIAFSGGVDSSFLLAAAVRAKLERLKAYMVVSQFVPKREIDKAIQTVEGIGADLELLAADILAEDQVAQNTKNRCYHCKHQIFSLIRERARNQGFSVFLHAVNRDDLGDFRPGLKAAEELEFVAPLAETGFTKSDIRKAARKMGLEVWNKPSQSCLATRIPYDTRIVLTDLEKIDQAESFLQDLSFDPVRVRCHGNLARIEVLSSQAARLFDTPLPERIAKRFKQIGFDYVSVDMIGYKTGNMNHEIL